MKHVLVILLSVGFLSWGTSVVRAEENPSTKPCCGKCEDTQGFKVVECKGTETEGACVGKKKGEKVKVPAGQQNVNGGS